MTKFISLAAAAALRSVDWTPLSAVTLNVVVFAVTIPLTWRYRAGGVLKLHDLVQMAREKARQRLREAGLGAELPPAEFEDTAHKVAVAAICQSGQAVSLRDIGRL